MKLQVFNGGLNTRLAPHLISIAEAVQYTNIDNESGSIVPFKKKKDISTNLLEFSHYFNAINEWVSSAVNRDYVEYRNTLYFSEFNTNPKKTTDNINFYNLGIDAPTVAPTVATGAAGVLTGTYNYLITYYNSADGTESAISPLSADVTPTTQQVDLSALDVSTDPQVDKKRIYRLGGNLTVLTLVTVIDNADTTYTDNIADTAVDGTILESSTYNEALSGLQFLTEHYGIFMAALNDKLYFTPIGKPNAWPPLNFIDFDSNITGIGKVLNGIIVFTAYRAYLITGTNINSFVKNTLSVTQGCREHKTIKHLSTGQLLWVSDDGVCTTTGSSISVVTKPKLSKQDYVVKNAVVHDEVYYLQLSNKTLLSIDTRYGLVFKNHSPDTTRLVVAQDVLYGFDNNTLYEMFNDTEDETYTWLSPVFTEGSYTELKNYKHVFIRAEGDFTIELFTNGVSVKTKIYSGINTHMLKIPQSSQDMYSMQIKLTGTAIIREIEFKALGRRNN